MSCWTAQHYALTMAGLSVILTVWYTLPSHSLVASLFFYARVLPVEGSPAGHTFDLAIRTGRAPIILISPTSTIILPFALARGSQLCDISLTERVGRHLAFS